MPMPASSTALRTFQWGAEVSNAQGTYTVAAAPTAGDTMTIGGTVYTFKTTAASAGDIGLASGTLATIKLNIVAAINGTDGLNTPNPCVLAAAFVGNVMTLTSRVAGVGAAGPPQTGNSITTTESMTSGSNTVQQAALTGGSGTRGTAVAATSKIVTEGIDFQPTDMVYRPLLAKGLLLANRGNEQVIARGTKWTMPDSPLNFEQAQHWFSFITSNYVFNAGTPNTWTFNWVPTNDPSPYSWSFQRRLSDGTNVNDVKFAYGMMSQLTIKTAQDKPVLIGATGFARRIQSGAITGNLSMPTPEIPASAQVTLYIDTTWAGLGGTAINAQVYQTTTTITSGLSPLVTSPGRTDLDFGTHLIDPSKVTIGLQALMLVSPGAQYDTEKAAAEAQTLRAVRLKIAGTGTSEIDVDMLMKHKAGSLFEVGDMQGQDIVTLDLVGSTDGTNFLRLIAKNAVSTLA